MLVQTVYIPVTDVSCVSLWNHQAGPEDVAWALAGRCRVEVHSQGVELLRRGEAAGALCLVASGELLYC